MLLRVAPPILCLLPFLIALFSPADRAYDVLRGVMGAAYLASLAFAIVGSKTFGKMSLAGHVAVLLIGGATFASGEVFAKSLAEGAVVSALMLGPWLTSAALVMIWLTNAPASPTSEHETQPADDADAAAP